MDGSILDVTKKLVGIEPEYTEFDTDIITHINSVFFILQELGVGPVEGFSIVDKTTKWSEFIAVEKINAVRSYMAIKVRLLFDPPATSFAITALQEQAKEFEWRLNVQQEGVRWQTLSETSSLEEV